MSLKTLRQTLQDFRNWLENLNPVDHDQRMIWVDVKKKFGDVEGELEGLEQKLRNEQTPTCNCPRCKLIRELLEEGSQK